MTTETDNLYVPSPSTASPGDLAKTSQNASDGAKTRLKRYGRELDQSPPFLLTRRDVSILEDIWNHRLLSTGQIEILRRSDSDAALRFVSRLTLQRRLQGLYHHKYINRIARPSVVGSREPLYFLDVQGGRELSKSQGAVRVIPLSKMPKDAAQDHILGINQVRVCLQSAFNRQDEMNLRSWKAGNDVRFSALLQIAGERKAKKNFIPDGMFTLKTPRGIFYYFLEVDLGTEPLKTITEKCRGYHAYWRTGSFANDYALDPRSAFRTLFVASSQKRAESILSAIDKLDTGRSLFWVTTEAQVTPESILTPIFRQSNVDHLCGFME